MCSSDLKTKKKNNNNIAILSHPTEQTKHNQKKKIQREERRHRGRGNKEKIERHTEIHKEITRRAGEKKGSTHTDKD